VRAELVINAPAEDAWVVWGSVTGISVSGRYRPAGPGTHAGFSPVVCPVFELGGQVIRTVSTVMRFDTAIEVTTSQLRIELMFPADDAAEAYFQAHQPI
jgi:hypothetical protein